MEENKKDLLYENIIEKEECKNIQEVEKEKSDEEYEQMILRYKRIKYSRYL